MHSNELLMFSEKDGTMPFGTGVFGILSLLRPAVSRLASRSFASLVLNNNQTIHLIINQINSL